MILFLTIYKNQTYVSIHNYDKNLIRNIVTHRQTLRKLEKYTLIVIHFTYIFTVSIEVKRKEKKKTCQTSTLHLHL